MTSNKAQKTAIRQRMAETGEPYIVARNTVLGAEGAEERYLRDAALAGVPADEVSEMRARLFARTNADQMRRRMQSRNRQRMQEGMQQRSRPRRPRNGLRKGLNSLRKPRT